MSSETATPLDRWGDLHVDGQTVILVGLTLLVQLGAAGVYYRLQSLAIEVPEQSSDPTIGPALVGIIIVESLLLVGLWRFYNRLPELVQKILKGSIYAVGFGIMGAILYKAGLRTAAVTVVQGLALFGGYKLLKRHDLNWIVFNAAAIVFGIGAVTMLSTRVAPVIVLPMLVIGLVWDYLAVDLSDIMGDLVAFSSSASIPNMLIIPTRARVDFDAVREWIADMEGTERPAGLGYVIGLGDFALPALLTVSAVVAIDGGFLPAPALGSLLGCCVAMVVLRHSSEQRDGSLPALPWLNTGAIAGFFAATLISGTPLLVALGVTA